MRVMERKRTGRRVVWLAVVGFMLVELVRPVAAEEQTLARLSFWVPPERMDEMEATYREKILPVFERNGLVEYPAIHSMPTATVIRIQTVSGAILCKYAEDVGAAVAGALVDGGTGLRYIERATGHC